MSIFLVNKSLVQNMFYSIISNYIYFSCVQGDVTVLNIDFPTILMCLQEVGCGEWTGLGWLRIGTGDGHL